ncbi:MAG: OadG family protein [Thermoplasmata archaeon]
MNSIEVVIIGLGVVFVTLGILTASTYLFTWIINKYILKENEEKEKVAAIVAAIRSRGGST